MKMKNGTIIYKWELPRDYPNFSGYDDLPDAYRVCITEQGVSGIWIEALYNGEWIVNPGNTRTLVRHLLHELGKIDE